MDEERSILDIDVFLFRTRSEEKKMASETNLNNFSLMSDSISKFSGEDKSHTASKWAQDVEDNAEIFGWTEPQKLVVARRSLVGTAALWLQSEKTFKKYNDLKVALQREFPDAINVKEMHELMASRRKKKEESYYQYMLIMKELGKRAKFPDYVAIQYTIDGISDYELNKAILYGATTYPALKEKLLLYEKMKSKSRREDRATKPSSKQETDTKNYTSSSSAGRKRCYKCGEEDHLASSCTNGVKCYRCNGYGHIGNQCPSNSNENGGPSSAAPSVKQSRDVRSGEKARQLASLPAKQSATADVRKQSAMFGLSANEEADGKIADAGYFDSDDNDSDRCRHDVNITTKQDFKTDSKSKRAMKMIKLCGVDIRALMDSGSGYNLINKDTFDELKVDMCADDSVFTGLGMKEVAPYGKFYGKLVIDEKCYGDIIFHVVPNNCMPYRLIVGREFLDDVTMLMRKGSVTIVSEDEEWLARVNCVNEVNVSDHIRTASVKEEVERLVSEYQPNQTKEAPIELKIILKDDIPVAQRPRRLSLAEQKIVEDQVDEWMQKGIIQVSFSEYTSPLVLVKKKDGSTRVCVDYRLLNKKMVKDEYPLPLIEDLIDKLRDAKVFSVLDLKNGFFHLRVSEESVPYTSFVPHHGQWEFLKAPFGLSVCPKYFMRFITIIFKDLIQEGVMMVFIDDIIIPAQTEQDALLRLQRVLEVAAENGLEINWKKARLICQEIEYLGHLVKEGQVQPSPEKVEAVARYPEPVNVKQVQSFIGLTSYFRKYIRDYAEIARPLTDLMKKDAKFIFGPEEREAFHVLRQKLMSEPVLKIFNPKLHTELHTDASSQALAGILLQKSEDGELHPVYYRSRRTSEVERRYSSYQLEALAVVESVKKFHHYLFGIHFKIVTDCQAFELTLKKKDLTPMVARWVLLLDQYDYEVEHRAGAKMPHADALSRIPHVVAVVSLHEKISQAQERDEELNAIRQLILKDGQYNDFYLENDILYKGDQWLLVVPKVLEKEVIKKVHSNGHFAMKKMKEAISKDYYMKNLDRKIEEVVTSCIPCLLATRKEGKQEGLLNPITKEGTPLHTLHLDHIGPLTETKKLYNHILTVVDAFTKFVWLYPTKSTSSAEVLSRLQLQQQTFGNPIRIITDRGTAFTSGAFQTYCEDEGIQHVTITTGVARANGQVEMIHRIMIPMLTKLCLEDQSTWYKHVGRVQRAINSTYQRSIDTSPFQLLTGTKMNCKEDVEILNLLQHETISQYDEERESLRQKAKEQIQKIQEENRKTYNKKRKESSKYEVGDLVAIKRTQFGPGLKLKPKFLGPYKVTKVKRNDRYDVEKLYSGTEGPNKTATTADFMKRWPEEDYE